MGNHFGGQTMVGTLKRVLVCDPQTAGWNRPDRATRWRALAYLREPRFDAAQEQHLALRNALKEAGASVLCLPEGDGLTLDAVYVHDASFMTDHGAILLRMGKTARQAEPPHHRKFFAALHIPVLGEIESPAAAEAGDLIWLDAKTLLAGQSERTNDAGIAQLRRLLAPHGVEVLTAALPDGETGFSCLHLMSLLSMLDTNSVLVDQELLPQRVASLLESRGLRLLQMDCTERATLACNVLSLGGNRLLALEENPRTNARLRLAGFDVRAFPGSELSVNGGGGPTCLTRPLLRES